jgi:NDP-sugar pyrophosphorylase family protein
VKTVLLAGGLGTRMREETEYRPKPMVEIGGRPILWHLMKLFAAAGQSSFVVATGYKSDMVKDYFLNYEGRNNDFTVRLGTSTRSNSTVPTTKGTGRSPSPTPGNSPRPAGAFSGWASTLTASASCARTVTVLPT